MSTITQHTTTTGRTYESNGKTYPSITTVLGQTKDKSGLDEWRKNMGASVADYIMHQAAEIGTDTHSMIEQYLQGNDHHTPIRSMLATAHFENLMKYLKHITHIKGIEMRMVSDEYGVAGTADCIARYKGKLSIIDYKTKRRVQDEMWLDDYFIQCTAYAKMYQELTGDMPDQLVILVSSEDNMSQEVIRYPESYFTKLHDRVQKYKVKCGETQIKSQP